jgi:putative intracellular protease/amidase
MKLLRRSYLFPLSLFSLSVMLCASANAQTAAANPIASAAPIRVAVYEDEGSVRAAAFFDENVGIDKAHFVLTHVTAKQIRNGVLKDYDVVIQGGGGSRAQADALQPAGRDAIREFVRNGGGYLGVCAGAYLAASDKDYQLGILNARVLDREHWARGRGDVVLDFSKTGQQELKFPHDKATVLYHQGPLLAPDNKADLPAYTPVALFETEVAEKGAPHGVMQGTTAMASGIFGKGRVFVISPHPEQTPGLDGLVRQAVAWAADRDVPVEIAKK